MTEHLVDVSFMPENTRAVFNELSAHKFISRFTLVGGTALSIQIGHRLSEDLDYIFDGEKINSAAIKKHIADVFPDHKIIRQDNGWQIDFLINGSKLTFFSTGSIALPMVVKDSSFSYKTMKICTAKTIASLKMSAIAQRNTMRDYYDLYYLSKHVYPLEEIIRQTKGCIPNLSPITYTETLVYTDDIEDGSMQDHLFPKENVTKYQIAEFFVEELKKIKDRLGDG